MAPGGRLSNEEPPGSAGFLVEVVAVRLLDVIGVVVLHLRVVLLLGVARGLSDDHQVAVGLPDLVQLSDEQGRNKGRRQVSLGHRAGRAEGKWDPAEGREWRKGMESGTLSSRSDSAMARRSSSSWDVVGTGSSVDAGISGGDGHCRISAGNCSISSAAAASLGLGD